MSEIRYWDRSRAQEEVEKVYGDKAVRMLYGNAAGFTLTDSLFAHRFLSRLYGHYQDSSLSAGKIKEFIQQFSIPMEDYEPGPFNSFNDFFIRRFRKGKRNFAQEPAKMPAFAEARYLAFSSVTESTSIPVKNIPLSPLALLGRVPSPERFEGGPAFIARLCPVDYHRFHFPDAGKITHSHAEHGKLHSVNPLALKAKPDIFLTNERAVHILETENFGRLAYIEVGALFVGRIVQSHVGANFQRGEEKGYFLFGGSTVIILGEPGRWMPDADILERSARGQECFVRLGEAIAKKL